MPVDTLEDLLSFDNVSLCPQKPNSGIVVVRQLGKMSSSP